MARRRKNDTGLPPRCVIRGGKVSYQPPTGGRITFHELGKNPDLEEVWERYRALQRKHIPTGLKALADAFIASERYKKYSERSAKNHQQYLTSLLRVFGESDFARARPKHINTWLEARGKTAKAQANKELSFLRLVLDYAVANDIIRANPARLVDKLPYSQEEKKAKRKAKQESYVSNARFDRVYKLMPLRGQISMELLFCLGIRIGDFLRLSVKDTQMFDEPRLNNAGRTIHGIIDIDEGKGINEYSREITDRVLAALELARTIEGVRSPVYLMHNQKGQKYTVDGFETNWRRWMSKVPPNDRFTPHQLRAKAISDWDGDRRDKWMFSRHKTESMVDTYDLKKKIVPSHDFGNIQ